MNDREEFLAALTEESAFCFNKIMKRHYASDDLFKVSEVLETLSKEQVYSMWTNLLHLCSLTLQGPEFQGDIQQEEELFEVLQTLEDVTTVAANFVSLDKPKITAELFQIVAVLHGVLLSLPEDAARLQNEIAKLCEYWFLADFIGKEEIVCNTIVYLLARTHLQSPMKADLKRVWDMKSAFCLLDFEDECSDGLKMLMQKCFCQPFYLGTDMGRKILVFFFTLDSCMVDHFHTFMKATIPTCQISFLDAVSEIYYEGWKVADISCKKKIETSCIQDLMHYAVHAEKPLFPKLESILMYIHKHKSQHNVDEMLYRLYQPILWRALKASNPLVRTNATTLLVDAFPLLDTTTSIIEQDQQRQMQLDALAELLSDSSPLVRAIAIQGVCKICFHYWEYIPVSTIKDFITKLTEELALDTSSSEVRVAVFNGLKYLINNRLSHSLLKMVLPNLRDLVHDNSQKVRRAFLDLLLAVKGIRTIKFWSIVPLEHLFARLEVENSTNCIKIIVKLLVNSYLPPKEDPASQFANCVELMWTSRRAARMFFKFAHFSASIKVLANFILLLTKCLLRSTGNSSGQENETTDASNGESNEKSNSPTFNGTDGEEQSSSPGDNDSHVEIDFTDKRLLVTMLEVLVVSWLGIKRKLEKGGNAKLREKLLSTLCEAVPKFLQNFEDGEARAAVIALASNLPPTPEINDSCISSLQNLPANIGPDEFGPIVHYLCSTGFAPDVLDHLHQSIKKGLNDPGGMQKRVQRKKGKGLKNDAKGTSVKMLLWILSQPPTRDAILQQKEKCNKLHELLKSSMDCLETLAEDAKCNTAMDKALKEKIDFLAECLSLSCKVGIHLSGQMGELEGGNLFGSGINVIDEFEYVLSWMERVLLPKIDDYGGSSLQDAASSLVLITKGKKRVMYDDTTQNFGASILKLIQNQLKLTSDVINLGFGSSSFHDYVATFIDRLSSHPSCVYILPDMMRASCDISRSRLSNTKQDQMDPVVKIIKACFANIRLSESQFPDLDSTQVLSAMKPYFTEVVKNRFCSQVAFLSEIPIMSTILSILVKDIQLHLSENLDYVRYESQDDLPTISCFITAILLKSEELERSLAEEILHFSTEKAHNVQPTISSLIYLVDVLVRSVTRDFHRQLLAKTIDDLEKNFNSYRHAIAKDGTQIDHVCSAAQDLLSDLVKRRTETTK